MRIVVAVSDPFLQAIFVKDEWQFLVRHGSSHGSGRSQLQYSLALLPVMSEPSLVECDTWLPMYPLISTTVLQKVSEMYGYHTATVLAVTERLGYLSATVL